MRTLPAIVVILMLMSACGADPEHGSTAEKRTSAVSPQDILVYDAAGRVKSVTPNRKHIIVEHGDIPGFMSAMTMPFALSDTSLATGLRPADSIAFRVEVRGPQIVVSDIEIIDD